MFDAKVVRRTEDGEKGVVQKECNEQQADYGAPGRVARRGRKLKRSRHCTHTTTIVKTPRPRQADACKSDHHATGGVWSRGRELNSRPADYEIEFRRPA